MFTVTGGFRMIYPSMLVNRVAKNNDNRRDRESVESNSFCKYENICAPFVQLLYE